MSRERFIWRNGEFVQVPNWTKPRPRLHVIGDTSEPFKSMADGEMYTSKSAYRREVKARGYEEVGNDVGRMTPELDQGSIEADVSQALAERGL